MKKIIYLSTIVLLGIFTFISCENENFQGYENLEDTNAIAKISNNKAVFAVDENVVKSKWENELEADFDGKIKFDKIKIIKIDGNYYLRGFSDEYVSTKLLVSQGKMLMPQGTTCTSKACATSSTSCMPQSDGSCSSCLFGDCTRSTSSD